MIKAIFFTAFALVAFAFNSILCRMGVMDQDYAAKLSRKDAHRNGEHLVRLCAAEQWLRKLRDG